VAAQVAALKAAGAGKVFREVASGAKTDRAQLRKAIATLEAGDVLMVTRLDRLARSTRDLLNTLAAITGRKAGFRSLGDTWADTTTSHGRLMLTVLGGLADDAVSAVMRSDVAKNQESQGLLVCGASHNPGARESLSA
jgi:DNA invertase Pin-like site-specific DNA recombinase